MTDINQPVKGTNRNEEFNCLISKRHRNAYEDTEDLDFLYDEKDVKKAIKDLKQELQNNAIKTHDGRTSFLSQDIIIDKIFGNELI